jgi:predicted Rossmann fold nucleotide-binding protein DprA/Smf involved in DNA uptake
MVRVGVTGHRPGRIPDVAAAARAAERALDELKARHPKLVVVTGGATGFDQMMAQACVRRRIPYELVLPCMPDLFTAYWRPEQRMMLAELCHRAVDVQVLYEHLTPLDVTPGVYHARNRAIVRQTDILVAFWNGRQNGGTWQTIQAAMEADQPVFKRFHELRTDRDGLGLT